MTESVQNKIIEIISVYINRNTIDETEIGLLCKTELILNDWEIILQQTVNVLKKYFKYL